MFVYVVLKDYKNNPKYIDKYICSDTCHVCRARFLCYTRKWNTFRTEDDFSVIFERDEISWTTILDYCYCCRLVTTDYDKILEWLNGGIC